MGILSPSNFTRLKTDIFKILKYTSLNKLKTIKINWKKEKSMTVVLCARDIQVNIKNLKIQNIDKINLSEKILFFTQTK